MRLFSHRKSGTLEPPCMRYRGLLRTAEEQARAAGYELVAGIDEAGRGALAGPVVAGAIILPPDRRVAHVVDSKRLDLASGNTSSTSCCHRQWPARWGSCP